LPLLNQQQLAIVTSDINKSSLVVACMHFAEVCDAFRRWIRQDQDRLRTCYPPHEPGHRLEPHPIGDVH
jgi:hypothetical protein